MSSMTQRRKADVPATGTAPDQPPPAVPTQAPLPPRRYGSWIGYHVRKVLDSQTPEEQGISLAPRPAAGGSSSATGQMPLFASAGPELMNPSLAQPLDADKNGNWLRLLGMLHLISFWAAALVALLVLAHTGRSLSHYLAGNWVEYVGKQIIIGVRTCIIHFAEFLLVLILLQAHCSLDYCLVEACQEAARNSSAPKPDGPTPSSKED